MATWKEKGVVPDSDDEDGVDSQSTASLEGNLEEQILNGGGGLEDDDKPENGNGEEETFQHEDPAFPEDVLGEAEPTIQQDSFPLIGQEYVEYRLEKPELPPISQSPNGFKDPRFFWASDDEDVPQVKSNASPRPRSRVSEEEISKSYVQITSPTSTRLSSPPSSETSLPPLNGQGRRTRSPSPQPDQIVLQRPITNARLELDVEPPSTARRSFRQRNPIQLHPYAMEQEKYRRTLQSRGIAPMRIASSSQDSRRKSRSSSPVSESQDVDYDLAESQQRDMDWDPPSSPPRSAEHAPVDEDGPPIDQDEDEEFPDIDVLLRNPPRLPKRPEPKTRPQLQQKVKHRLKTYSAKTRRPSLSRIQTHPLGQTRQRDITDSIFDVPASPPATSSPCTATSRLARTSISRGGSISKEATPSTSPDEVSLLPGELPTPATSAVKPVSILVDSDIEGNDPFASDVENSASASSSSDESIQIRKISKKIRGVLPASHLRLDQKKLPKPTVHNLRETQSLSPVKELFRRGVALPRMRQAWQTSPTSTNVRLAFLSDSGEDDENEVPGFLMADDRIELESIFDQSRLGFADEDDRIDAMLPSKKRLSAGSSHPRKKRKSGSGLGVRTESGTYNQQPKITDHLKKPKSRVSASKSSRRQTGVERDSHRHATSRPRKPAAPRLGILDVMNPLDCDEKDLPQFIRVAARTARSRMGQGRQNPSKKFIRLANREDTQDVQSVLQDWREGKIAPKNRNPQPRSLGISALHQITDNQQTRLPPPISKSKLQRSREVTQPGRKLVISRRQQSMNSFVTREPTSTQEITPPVRYNNESKLGPIPRNKPRRGQHSARPAQLEATEIPYSERYSASAFRSTKKALDALYRSTRRRPAPQTNLQLSRFLADDDIVRPSIETNHDPIDEEDEVELVPISSKPAWRKKRLPKRVDAGAANYRQPSDPLLLDYFAPNAPNNDENSKLQGLGKFGTSYPYHFDTFPLQPGIFFHESTIIGSGRLSNVISVSDSQRLPSSATPGLRFADKVFSWQTWNESVSSEIGVCLDWLLDQLQAQQASTPLPADANEVITFVLDYVQYNVQFDGALDRDDFMSRMVEVFREFSTRLNVKGNIDQKQARLVVEVLSRCMLVILHLLQTSRVQPTLNSSSYDLEDLLKSVASHCAAVLVSDGLHKLRKLYDDLQYLSFRERGITGEHYAANGWVILVKVLSAAQIPRGSFWDVINPRLATGPMQEVIDAPTMEKLWYSMYTLLPLCEFDSFGVVDPGLRQRANFDNWSLPQQILKQVFALYKSNQRQPPGFNDYCRSLFHRCHYLMMEWGWWKCPAIIGTLFDFFASHNLAHLRNEEVHASPPFLEQLDTDPSLSIEPEDRCFHIFLKVVALGIKHLSQADDMKSIRNLVARLLPNHDRQYPKDEVVHTRDLAALRNHHDLLCTLFWASPPSQRPSVALIQELVIADRSHNEACLINIRAWENLTRFVVTKSTNVESYKPFGLWQTSFFTSLCQQYIDAEQEARHQAETLEKVSGQVMSESRIADTIFKNKRSMVIPMCRGVTAMSNTIKVARSSNMVREALNCDVLSKALDPMIHSNVALSKPLLSYCLVALVNYMDQIKHLHPPTLAPTTVPSHEEESQDSLDMDIDWGRMELIIPLRQNVVNILLPLIRSYLEAETDQGASIMSSLVECWARLVAIVTEEGAMPLEPFLTRGQFAVFENRRTCRIAKTNWPLFLASLLKDGKTLRDFQVPGFDIGSEWLLALSTCQSIPVPVQALTTQLQQQGHYLCTTIDLRTYDQIQMIRAAIRSMSSILIDKTTDTEVGLPQKQTQRLFSDMLGEAMKSMQSHLESLEPGSDLHSYHLQIARVVVADIKSYASDFRQLIDFFIHPSAHYWPHDGDPSLYRAGLVAYCLRLEQQPDKAAFELYYYLRSGWTNSLVSNRMDNFIGCVRTGMKWWDFTKFMLSDFVPAILTAGFHSSAWLLCSIFLPAISNRVIRLLDSTDNRCTWVFENLLNILKMIMNGTIMQARLYERNLLGVHPDHRGILAVTFRFWLAIALPMRQYATRHSQESALEEVTDPLSSFIYHAVHAFQTGDPFIQVPEGQFDVHKGKYTDNFVKHIVEDIKDNWQFSDDECFGVVVKIRSNECSTLTVFRESLREVLEGDLDGYECAYPNKGDVLVEKMRNVYIQELYV
ncbi:Mus7/MMS22 family-domain-containing protein [Rhexocercosporidium sp. MPI-PUGE-AT-0058]|nr:Mus7/MMS22 family-domain-containing protein [Rhexocercosporidium sp. MPI-PUGE-AT-0058]